MARGKTVFLATSLDVEEEGLFGGHYERVNPAVANIASLSRLEPLLERGVRPTLFCAWSVLANSGTTAIIDNLRKRYALEIGAHLHHWNTPPQSVQEAPRQKGVPAALVSKSDMAAKLAELFGLAAAFNGSPVRSFRMGRWDLHRQLWPLLLENGVHTDASVRPFHAGFAQSLAPDHFAAPTDPYWVCLPEGKILEVPLTVAPLLTALGRPLAKGWIGEIYRGSFRHWGCLALLPVQHPLWLMKLATSLHLRQGGQTLSLTWHSSEMMPGGAPHMPDEKSVKLFMAKIEAYLHWLEASYDVRHKTMSELRQTAGDAVAASASRSGDWSFGFPA